MVSLQHIIKTVAWEKQNLPFHFLHPSPLEKNK